MAGIPVLIFANKQDLLSSKPAEVSCALFKNKFFLLYFLNVTPSTRLFSLTHSLFRSIHLNLSRAGSCWGVEWHSWWSWLPRASGVGEKRWRSQWRFGVVGSDNEPVEESNQINFFFCFFSTFQVKTKNLKQNNKNSKELKLVKLHKKI